MLEFAWKGQMSYANAMHMVLKRTWNSRKVVEVVPEEIRRGPAHFTPQETDRWWNQILDHWPVVEVTQFGEVRLADGKSGSEIDLNDLVRVKNFDTIPTKERPFLFNGAQAPEISFLTVASAGEEIGFQLSWPAKEDRPPAFYGPKKVHYGIEYWEGGAREWQSVVDPTLTRLASRRVEQTFNDKPRHVVEGRHEVARSGTYRIEVGKGRAFLHAFRLGLRSVPQSIYDAETAHLF